MLKKIQIKEYEKGAFYMILSSFFATFFALFVKIAVEIIYLPWILFLRFFLPLLFILIFSIFKKSLLKQICFKKKGLHLLRALTVVISQLSLLYYFTKGSLTDGVTLWNTSPIFIPIVSYIFFRQKTSPVVWCSLSVSFLGVLLILKPSNQIIDPFSIFGFISGISVAISQVLYTINRETDSLINNLFLFFLNASIITGVILFSFFTLHGFDKFFFLESHPNTFSSGAILLAIAIASTMNQFLRGIAFSLAKPSVLSPFIYVSVVFSAIIDTILRPGEIVGFFFILGIALIIIGSLIPIFATKQLP
jgi:drug/metabolite transporter (DMT)-like permease